MSLMDKPEGGKLTTITLLDDPWLGETIPFEALPKPERFHILLKQVNIKRKVGSVLIPDSVQHDQQWSHGMGLVVALGPAVFQGQKFVDMGLSPETGPQLGDIYWFEARAPRRLKVDGELYLLIADDGLLAKFDRKHLDRMSFNIT